jgi:hypothetical protein
MNRLLRRSSWLALAALVSCPLAAGAQGFETVGTRASGMGGAFVGVADDASAVYWNPAGLASGAYFSLLLDRNTSKTTPDDDPRGGSSNGFLVALSTPALGLGYYRVRATSLTPLPTVQAGQTEGFTADSVFRVDTLVTHQAGAALVHSLTDRVAVGATIKLVRGVAASTIATTSDRDALLEETMVAGVSSTKLDADIGIVGVFGGIRAGVTARNLRQPEFKAADGGLSRRLDRQVRAGISLRQLGVLIAADVDLTRNAGPFGDVREFAAGAEARVLPRAFVRGGFRMNTLEDSLGDRGRVLAAGGSFAVMGSLMVDAQISTGSGAFSPGWGVAGRIVF